ncbi:MAG TPA: chorismate mutase [Bacillota bacterium]|nr:chorismate mutase [Bacillota bacterium]
MGGTVLRGIRGAITVKQNSAGEIVAATRELLQAIISENGIEPEDMASVFFTVTPDLDAEFPATAARELGLKYVPLLCTTEINVPGSLDRCIRVLVHVNTRKSQKEIRHVYLKEAVRLREDLAGR